MNLRGALGKRRFRVGCRSIAFPITICSRWRMSLRLRMGRRCFSHCGEASSRCPRFLLCPKRVTMSPASAPHFLFICSDSDAGARAGRWSVANQGVEQARACDR